MNTYTKFFFIKTICTSSICAKNTCIRVTFDKNIYIRNINVWYNITENNILEGLHV